MTAATLSRKGQLLKLNLEQALTLHRQGTSSRDNLYGLTKTREILETALLRARCQTQTYILVALFGIGLAFKTGDITFDPCSSDHVVAQFLAAYFIEEPGAIYQVKDISITNIACSKKNHAAILAA